MKIISLNETASTNDEVRKYLPSGENTIVCAKRQLEGRGTKGRAFLSDEGGVYLSALIFPDLAAAQAFRIMAHAAVSVCRTILRFHLRPEIKWANDVLIENKKCCGILIENLLNEGNIRASIVGIGLNVKNDVSSLNGIACSLQEHLRTDCPSVETVRDTLIENFSRESTFEEYLSFVGFLGKRVKVVSNETFFATAKRILPDGRLELEYSGEILRLSAGEISVRWGEES